MGYRNFESGDYVSASAVQAFMMDQQVFIFSDAAARDAAFASASSTTASAYPLEGMLAYIGSGSFVYYDGSTWEKWPP